MVNAASLITRITSTPGRNAQASNVQISVKMANPFEAVTIADQDGGLMVALSSGNTAIANCIALKITLNKPNIKSSGP